MFQFLLRHYKTNIKMNTDKNLRYYYTYWDSESNTRLDGFIDNIFTTSHKIIISAIKDKWQKNGYKNGSNIEITHHE